MRGKGLAHEIKDKIEKEARERGCESLNCTVLADNPIGLEVELKDGFIFTDFFIDKDNKMKFFGYKRLDSVEEADKKQGSLGELREVGMSEVGTLRQMVSEEGQEKWSVIDIKNSGDRKNNNPGNWTLILERIQ